MIREAVSRLASTVSPSSSTLKRLSSPSTIVISVQAQTGLHRTQGSDNRVTCIQINQQIPMFFPSLFFPLYFRDPYIVSSNPEFLDFGSRPVTCPRWKARRTGTYGRRRTSRTIPKVFYGPGIRKALFVRTLIRVCGIPIRHIVAQFSSVCGRL